MKYDNYADAIKHTVSMRQVAERYGFTIDYRTRKILCPFHDDHNRSMQIYAGDRGYYCFVCGHGGDVIDFTQRLFGLSFTDTCKKMNDDFNLHLGIGERESYEKRKEREAAWERRRQEMQKRKDKEKLLLMIYHAAYNKYTFLDILKCENKPKSPDDINQEYIYACKHIDEAWAEVQEAEENLRKYKEEQRQQH